MGPLPPAADPRSPSVWTRIDPFAWCEVDRALAFVLAALVFRVGNAVQASLVLRDPEIPRFLDAAVLGRIVPALWAVAGWWALLGAVGAVLRKKRPNENAYVLTVLTSFWLTNAGIAVLIGVAQGPFWIVVAGASVAMMLCFGFARTFGTFLPGILVVLGSTLATRLGMMRYAPLLSRPPYDDAGRPETAWLLVVGGTSIAVTAVTVFAVQFLLHRLRDHEHELRRLTRTDPLTGVGNRRAFFERFELELSRQKRHAGSVGVVVVDVDHFKNINDTFGHPIGDEALRSVAQALSDSVREEDFVARMGGEEFALVLPATALDGAEVVAERCRKAIDGMTITGPGGAPVRITATFGVTAVSGEGGTTVDAVLRDADGALYRGKRDGRNRVVVAER
jgi:diguanylate cyclase (GGDEF)-like protein